MRKLFGFTIALAFLATAGADNRSSEKGFTTFVRDAGIGTSMAIAAWDTGGFTQMSSDAVIRAMFAPDSKFDSLQAGGYRTPATLTAIWSGTATADSSTNNLFFQNFTGTGTVRNVTGLFGNAFSARTAGFLERRHTTQFDVAGNWSISMFAGRFVAGNPSANEVLFSVYTSPDIVHIGLDPNGNAFARLSDDGRATFDSVGVTADVADSAYHFISLRTRATRAGGRDSLHLAVDNSRASVVFSNAATGLTLDTVRVFGFRSGNYCRCRADVIWVIDDTLAADRHMRNYAWRALREAAGSSTDSFRVHIAGIGTDSAHVDTQVVVGMRTPVATSRTWHAFETGWLDSNEAIPVLIWSGATTPRGAALDTIPAGRLSFDIAQLLIGDNERGVSVLEEAEFHHEGVTDTTLWELRIYDSIEDTRDLSNGYDVYTARLHPNQNRALLRINRILTPASFANVYVQGTAATTGSAFLRGRRR